MSRLTKSLLFLFLLGGFNPISLVFGQDDQNSSPGKITGKTIGFEVIFVVDISYGFAIYSVDKVVESAYDKLEYYSETKNIYHLITFTYNEALYDGINSPVIEGLKIRIKPSSDKHHQVTCPEDALIKVVDFFNKKSPLKIGIVFFIYEPSIVNSRYDLQKNGRFLERIGGFNVFYYLLLQKETEADIRRKIEQIAANFPKIEPDGSGKGDEFDSVNFVFQKLLEEKKLLENQLNNEKSKVKLIEGSEKELIGMVQRRDKKISILNSVLLTSFGVFIVVLIILLKDKMSFYQHKRKILWGKLIPLTDKNNREPYNFSKMSKKGMVETTSKLSNIKFYQDCQDGKRVMKIQVESGCIECLDENNKPCRSNQYVEGRTRFIKLTDPVEGESFFFKYEFLDIIEDGYEKSVWEPPGFKGRRTLIKEIKNNFLGDPKYRFHYIVSGMGNSGKTSFMMHLCNKIFNEDDMAEQYAAVLIQDDNGNYTDFNSFETYFNHKINGIDLGERKLIILIDDYDKIADRFDEENLGKFKALIEHYHNESKYFFIISGQTVFSPGYANHLPPYTHKVALGGIDDHNLKEESGHDAGSTLELVDSILIKIGLSRNHLSKAVKKEIARYSNGIPYFVMRMLYELLNIWLDDYKIYSIRKKNVEEAALKVANSSDYAMIEKICTWENKHKNNDFLQGVSISDVLNKISMFGKGKINKLILMEKLGFIQGEDKKNGSKRFDEIIKQLKETGLIIEEGDDIMGIPHLFYFKGGTTIDGSRNN